MIQIIYHTEFMCIFFLTERLVRFICRGHGGCGVDDRHLRGEEGCSKRSESAWRSFWTTPWWRMLLWGYLFMRNGYFGVRFVGFLCGSLWVVLSDVRNVFIILRLLCGSFPMCGRRGLPYLGKYLPIWRIWGVFWSQICIFKKLSLGENNLILMVVNKLEIKYISVRVYL